MPVVFKPFNLNSTAPAAPTGKQLLVWQNDTSSPVNVNAYNPDVVGDTGSGGKAGNVPTPAAGDAAANKFLKADGHWTALGSASGQPSSAFDTAGAAAAAQAASLPASTVIPANTTAVTHQFFTAYNSTTGAFTQVQPAAADISGLAASATTDATNAANIGSGTLPDARLSSNVPLKGSVNTFTANNYFNGGNVGIGTAAPPQRLAVQTANPKATTATTNCASFSSNDAAGSADLGVIVRVGGNATAGSRWSGIISYEYGTGSRALVLQDLGGNVLIASTADNGTDKLQVSGSISATGVIKIGSGNAPATSSSTGVAGSIAWDSGFLYICVAANSWKRIALTTF